MMEEAEKHFAGRVKFYSVDIDKASGSGQFVDSVPTYFVISKDGRLLAKFVGAAQSSKAVIDAIEKVLKKN